MADVLLNGGGPAETMQRWCRKYPDCSYGNGAAMRVSPAALLHHDDLGAALNAAERVTKITHNHELGIAGALATTHAVHLALNGAPAKPCTALSRTSSRKRGAITCRRIWKRCSPRWMRASTG